MKQRRSKMYLPARPPWKPKALKENLKFFTLTPILVHRMSRMKKGAKARAVKVVDIICGGLRSGSLNMCLISGRGPLNTVGTAGAAADPSLNSTAPSGQRVGLLITASPMISSMLYLPDNIPSSLALAPTS